jgi:hypothetical protein
MSQVANAFKMPYEEREPEDFVSFDKRHAKNEKHSKMEIYDTLYRDDDSAVQNSAVRGYD